MREDKCEPGGVKREDKVKNYMDALKGKLSVTRPGAPLFGNAAIEYRLKKLEQSIAYIKEHLENNDSRRI